MAKQTKITKSARGQSCIRCGTQDDTVCARHYNGYRSHSYGKGRGIKCHDIASAELCNNCDLDFSESNYQAFEGGSKSIDRSEQFLDLCMKTNIRRFQNGVIAA